MAIDIQSAFSPRSFAGIGAAPTTGGVYLPGVETVVGWGQRLGAPFAGSGERAKCDYPWYCFNWLGQLISDECRTFTEAELRACQAADLGPAMPPATIEEALRRGDESVAAYLRMHPEEAAAYYQDLADPNRDLKNIGWAALAIGGVLVLTVLSRR